MKPIPAWMEYTWAYCYWLEMGDEKNADGWIALALRRVMSKKDRV